MEILKTKAKYYIYRNLHTDSFSVKYKGKVISRPKSMIGINCKFVVSEKGRQRVLKEKRKNVHAMVAVEKYIDISDIKYNILKEIKYNPYYTKHFEIDEKPVFISDYVLFKDNKIYKIEEET